MSTKTSILAANSWSPETKTIAYLRQRRLKILKSS